MIPLPTSLIDRLASELGDLPLEVLVLIYLDRAGAFLGDEVISGGTRRSHELPYRKLFELTFRRGANRLVLAHNHPSGSASPSDLDVTSTRGLQALGAPMEIEIVDHFIVAANSVFSMRSAGLLR